MSEVMEKRAARRALQAAKDAIGCIEMKRYTDAEHLLQAALEDVRKAAAQRKGSK